MNDRLKQLLMSVFALSESEFNVSLSREDVSNWDSLKQMDLVTRLEKEFDITLEMLEIVGMQSISQILEVLRSKGVDVEG